MSRKNKAEDFVNNYEKFIEEVELNAEDLTKLNIGHISDAIGRIYITIAEIADMIEETKKEEGTA